MTVGGVAPAAAAAQLAERSKKDAKRDATHADFYRFQQRDRRRSGELWLVFGAR